ncbi:cytochrome c biogenesis protein ResB [Amnibacterium kyonggiense]|uniref:Cytochrome c biogenesis protein n=1 Tax=Amnibacterium kyonggiense TaxID=595671 RepID=A0A4R7FPI1_9MICO|nr:cytochrome c biogenesis protein ResB [Amnibacterium kyonggiense]TDS79650.1 cytochrome c biogenesis protein [Amnibacterium kyonggiense]
MSRPSDAQDRFTDDAVVVNPRLGPLEWLRWGWRTLTSMRTALLLLLALAVAAVPGSLIPQNSSDPNGVAQYKAANPGLTKIVNALQGFDVYTSFWFSAIYLLLFISLIGCVVPRLRHHWTAMRKAPPRTPSRFTRLPFSSSIRLHGVDVDAAVDAGERVLRASRYRTARYGSSVSAERGYLRETGNLLFHSALVGVLIAVFVGGGFTYTGQRVLVTGDTFANTELGYDSLSPGRFFGDGSLAPYALRLDKLDVTYEQRNVAAFGQPLDYTAHVSTKLPDGAWQKSIIKVNSPLDVAGTSVYLLGNGYAPEFTVRNADGSLAFHGSVAFRPQNAQMTSLGVVKVSETTDRKKQIGLVGFLYPTPAEQTDGSFTSIFPSVGKQSLVSFFVYEGDVGLDSGAPRNVYELDTSKMKQVAGRTDPVQLTIGQTKTLPDGLGTVTLDGITRYAAFDIHHDPSQGIVALFVALAVLGLITSLLVPRRRLWIKVREEGDEVVVEYAGLARGDDPNLARAVAELESKHRAALPEAAREPAPVP